MPIGPTTLCSRDVRLEPLDEATHRDGLAAAIRDGELWRIPWSSIPHPDDLPAFFADARSAQDAGREVAFATVDARSGRIAGSTRFRNIEAAHRRLEIGFTFLGEAHRRGPVNTAAKVLMLDHAFGPWGMHRVELLTDVLNDPSRAAIARIGATQEGVLRRHMVMRDGRVRDSVLFAILAEDWPAARRRLLARRA